MNISCELYYSLEELPIYNWYKFHENGDVNWFVKSKNSTYKNWTKHLTDELKNISKKLKKKPRDIKPFMADAKALESKLNEFKDIWLTLFQEYIDLYGLDTNYQMILEKKKQIISHEVRMLEDKKRHHLNMIRLLQAELKELQSGESVRIERVMMQLSKMMGFKIDAKTTSVIEYKELIKEMERNNKKQA